LRWLVSTCDTIIDHDKNSLEVAYATSVTLLVNTIKLYETEEVVVLQHKNILYPDESPKHINLFDGIFSYSIGGGDMILNMMNRIIPHSKDNRTFYKVLKNIIMKLFNRSLFSPKKKNISHYILLEVLNRIHINNTVYRRMSNIHKNNKTRWWDDEQFFIKKP